MFGNRSGRKALVVDLSRIAIHPRREVVGSAAFAQPGALQRVERLRLSDLSLSLGDSDGWLPTARAADTESKEIHTAHIPHTGLRNVSCRAGSYGDRRIYGPRETALHAPSPRHGGLTMLRSARTMVGLPPALHSWFPVEAAGRRHQKHVVGWRNANLPQPVHGYVGSAGESWAISSSRFARTISIVSGGNRRPARCSRPSTAKRTDPFSRIAVRTSAGVTATPMGSAVRRRQGSEPPRVRLCALQAFSRREGFGYHQP